MNDYIGIIIDCELNDYTYPIKAKTIFKASEFFDEFIKENKNIDVLYSSLIPLQEGSSECKLQHLFDRTHISGMVTK